jgi:hypothetical protein
MNFIAAVSSGPRLRLYAELFAGIWEYGIPLGESPKEPLLRVLRKPLVGVPLLNMNGFGAWLVFGVLTDLSFFLSFSFSFNCLVDLVGEGGSAVVVAAGGGSVRT